MINKQEAIESKRWHKYAVRQANLARKLPQIERTVAETKVPTAGGVLDLGEEKTLKGYGIRVFFGNDGFLEDDRSRRQVRILRRLLCFEGVELLGFGVDTYKRQAGNSWALVVRSDKPLAKLSHFLNAAHALAFFRNHEPLKGLCDWYLEGSGISHAKWGRLLGE